MPHPWRQGRPARAAQPAWARSPLAEQQGVHRAVSRVIVAELETLAATLTAEVGKPIRQSRNELNGLLGRIDFFLGPLARALAEETVFSDAGMTERDRHEPLGVVANVSAWNYPWFVGANVFVPALLTGNAVLYKPSECATLTGLEIGRLLHAAGMPADVFIVLSAPARSARRWSRRPRRCVLHRLVRNGSADRLGRRAADGAHAARARRQGPDLVCVRRRPRVAAASLADGAMYNTGQSCCSVERIYVHEPGPRRVR